jgi:hypothetical protein
VTLTIGETKAGLSILNLQPEHAGNCFAVVWVSDPNRAVLSVAAVSATSANGGRVVPGGGSVTYSLATDSVGADLFSFTVSAGRSGMVAGLVEV